MLLDVLWVVLLVSNLFLFCLNLHSFIRNTIATNSFWQSFTSGFSMGVSIIIVIATTVMLLGVQTP